MITDFFIADKDKAFAVNDYSDVERFPLLKAKNVESIKLLTLEEILTGETSEIIEPIKEFESGDAWVIPISKKLIEELIKMKELSQIALMWSETDEWILDNGKIEDLMIFLVSLKKLASQAISERKDVFVLISL